MTALTLALGAVLYIASGTIMGFSDCWEYLKALRANRRHKEK